MRIKYLIGLVLCVAVLALSGCGSKSSDSTPAPLISKPVSTTAVTGIASKGPISGATVNVFAIRNGIPDSVPLGSAQTDIKGVYTVETFGYHDGPVLVEVTGGSYTDEISNATVTLNDTLRAMFSSAQTPTTTMAVTPLTELAVHKALGSTDLTGDVIDQANIFIASKFGISDIVTSLPSNSPGANNDQKNYAIALGGISQLVTDMTATGGWAFGRPLNEAFAVVMSHLGGELQTKGSFTISTLISINTATTQFAAGGTTTPPSIIPPLPPPPGGVLTIGTTGIPSSDMTQINVTLVLPAGVTVDTVAPGNVTLSGVAAVGARGSIAATFTAGTGTAPGTVAISVTNTPFGVGEFATIKFKFNPPGNFPTLADFTFTGLSATLHAGLTVGGIVAAPLHLVAL